MWSKSFCQLEEGKKKNLFHISNIIIGHISPSEDSDIGLFPVEFSSALGTGICSSSTDWSNIPSAWPSLFTLQGPEAKTLSKEERRKWASKAVFIYPQKDQRKTHVLHSPPNAPVCVWWAEQTGLQDDRWIRLVQSGGGRTYPRSLKSPFCEPHRQSRFQVPCPFPF